MSMMLNEYEVEDLVARLDQSTPNLLLGAQRLDRLIQWTNRNSDGWPYWKLPSNAAAKLQALLASAGRIRPEDCTPAELKAACAPIKAFLTKRGVDHDIVFADPPPPPPRNRWSVSGPDLPSGAEHLVEQDNIRAGLLDMVTSDLPGISRIDVHTASGVITYERTDS